MVRDQLVAGGVDASPIWVVPYGVDRDVFAYRKRDSDSPPFRVMFAGQQSLRKGIRYILQALEQMYDKTIELHCFGHGSKETEKDFAEYKGESKVVQHGTVSQEILSEEFNSSDLLVLPSLEEGYGLVVIQALACGLPCLVSEQVGAKDALVEGTNGMVVKGGDAGAWASAIRQARTRLWDREAIRQTAPTWEEAATKLMQFSEAVVR